MGENRASKLKVCIYICKAVNVPLVNKHTDPALQTPSLLSSHCDSALLYLPARQPLKNQWSAGLLSTWKQYSSGNMTYLTMHAKSTAMTTTIFFCLLTHSSIQRHSRPGWFPKEYYLWKLLENFLLVRCLSWHPTDEPRCSTEGFSKQ